MLEGFQYLPPQQPNVPVGYDPTAEQPIPFSWVEGLTSELQGQPASPQEMFYFTDGAGLTYPSRPITAVHAPILGVTHPWGAVEPKDITLKHDDLSCQDFGINTQDIFAFEGDEFLPADDEPWPLIIPSNTAAGPPTSSTMTDSSPRTPLEPYIAGHFPSHESPAIKLPDTNDPMLLSFDEDEHSQPDDVLQIPPNLAAFFPSVIELKDVEDHLKAVGSTQIQKAAGKRRKKDGIHGCPFRNAPNKCNSTFTARHNLRYHIFAHLGYKPYKCGKCTYAASSPATTKRHQSTCKGPSYSTVGNA